MNSKDLAIGVLSTTAVILLVGLLIIHTRPESARAAGVTETAGDYVMTVGVSSIDNEEVLYVIDAPAEKMIAYRFNASRSTIDLLKGIDLSQYRRDRATKSSAKPGNRRSKGKPGRRSRGKSRRRP